MSETGSQSVERGHQKVTDEQPKHHSLGPVDNIRSPVALEACHYFTTTIFAAQNRNVAWESSAQILTNTTWGKIDFLGKMLGKPRIALSNRDLY